MSDLKKLPNRAPGYTQKFIVGDVSFYLRTTEHPDGTLGAIRLNLPVYMNETASSLIKVVEELFSMGLKHGVPLEEMVDRFLFTNFPPHGMVRGHARIRSCTSILDLVVRDLAITYLGRDDLAHVTPEGVAV